MANTAPKRISQLDTTTSLQANDRLVVLTNPNTATVNTQTIAVPNFIKSFGNNLPGPYSNDSVANTNGVAVKSLYYDSTGVVRIRLV